MRFERFCRIVEEESREIPKALLAGLDGGIHCERPVRSDPDDDEIVLLGHYEPGFPTGPRIVLHHGSFEAMEVESDRIYRVEIRRTVRHELRHHWEDAAGLPDLRDEDSRWLGRHRRPSRRERREEERRAARGARVWRALAAVVAGSLGALPVLLFPEQWMIAGPAGLAGAWVAWRLFRGRRKRRRRKARRHGRR